MNTGSGRCFPDGVLVLAAVLVLGSSWANAQFVPGHDFDDPTPTGADEFGFSVAIDGNHVVIGARDHDTPMVPCNDTGQAHLFDATTGLLVHTFDDPTVTCVDQFGHAVAVSGNNVVVGAPFDDSSVSNGGQVNVFDATTFALLRTFDDPTPTVTDNFGFSVSADGNAHSTDSSEIIVGESGG